MEHLTIPQGYVSPLTIRETEIAIKLLGAGKDDAS